MILPAEAPAAAEYRVEIESETEEARTLKTEGRDARSVQVLVPAAEVPRGSYAFRLFAIDAGGVEQRIPGSYFLNIE